MPNFLLGILGTVLKLAHKLAEYLSDKQLMEAGEAKAMVRSLNKEKERVLKAKRAIANLNDDQRKRLSEKYGINDNSE